MRKPLLALSLIVLSALPSATAQEVPTETESSNAFALKLYSQLKSQPGNLFFSSFSVRTALAMAYGGARGATAEQMAAALGFPPGSPAFHSSMGKEIRLLTQSEHEDDFQLHVANALWGQKGYTFRSEFLEMNRSNYSAALERLDFAAPKQAAERINAWVSKNTHGKIQDLVSPDALSKLTRLVLTNAIYFKAKWSEEFKPLGTEPAPFSASGGKKADVRMMHQQEHFEYAEDADTQVLEMDYRWSRASMVILLPRKRDGLAALEEKLNPEKLDALLKSLQRSKVDVFVPRFKTASTLSLGDTLRALGMTDAFTGKADFSGVAEDKQGLFLSAILHKAYVSVDEEGTEAAAATAVAIMGAMAAPPEAPAHVFRADHPFIYLIREARTGAILFIGRMVEP